MANFEAAISRRGGAIVRCAVYTRKSSEEGLEQDFNSLHAQREACEAYIKSQKHEGWVVLPAQYDDGGISGATMERPALQQLLADIRARKIDTVVVYKVDRLTRSLADFAKIVEIFDAHGVAFVSVTQHFNTTTSMGRLTLNVLLSFAQFEREVAGERIRDKIAASKQRGMWMGGNPPLGYDVRDRKLVVNERRGGDRSAHLSPLRGTAFGAAAGGRLGQCRDHQQAVAEHQRPSMGRPTIGPWRALFDAAEPHLPRRNRPQGPSSSWPACPDRRSSGVEPGPGTFGGQCWRPTSRTCCKATEPIGWTDL